MSSAHEDTRARKHGSLAHSRYRGLVSFTPQPLYPPGKNLQHGFVKGWVDPTSGLLIVLPLPVIEPRLLRRPTCNLVNIPYILVKVIQKSFQRDAVELDQFLLFSVLQFSSSEGDSRTASTGAIVYRCIWTQTSVVPSDTQAVFSQVGPLCRKT